MAFPISGSFTESQIEKLNAISNDAKNTERQKNQTLDKDAFLKLMTVQLQHQDPLSPMDNSEYINQMAQFSSVEQLSNISSAMTSNNSLSVTIADQLAQLTSLIKTMNETNSGTSTDVKTGQDKIIEQNETIVNELIKLNSALSSYFAPTNNSTSEDLLASLGI